MPAASSLDDLLAKQSADVAKRPMRVRAKRSLQAGQL